MTELADDARSFRVHARHIDSHHARIVQESSFEAAAIAYLEHLDLAPPAGDDHDISVIVHDVATGREHCFRMDLDSGETEPCG